MGPKCLFLIVKHVNIIYEGGKVNSQTPLKTAEYSGAAEQN